MVAFVANNAVPRADLPALFEGLHSALKRLADGGEVAPAAIDPPAPAVSIRRSVTPDYLICLDDGKRFKSLRRHLATLGMTPEQYRAKWNLPSTYPMVAPNSTARRSAFAKNIGFGLRENVNVKRVYEQPADADGTRVLVDRVWPRGLTKQRAAVDVWLKEIAPSADLRKWFGHDPSRWKEFEARYRAELDKNGAAIDRLRELIDKGPVTLLYGAHDEAHNNAVALRAYLDSKRDG
jgi:uncharacterized protein YeaO (DUF488 family)